MGGTVADVIVSEGDLQKHSLETRAFILQLILYLKHHFKSTIYKKCLSVCYLYSPRKIITGSPFFLPRDKHNNWGGFASKTGFLSFFIPVTLCDKGTLRFKKLSASLLSISSSFGLLGASDTSSGMQVGSHTPSILRRDFGFSGSVSRKPRIPRICSTRKGSRGSSPGPVKLLW